MFEVFSLWRQGLLPAGRIGKKMRLNLAGELLGTIMIVGGCVGMLLVEHPVKITGRPVEDGSLPEMFSLMMGLLGIALALVTTLELTELRNLFRDVRNKLLLSLENYQQYRQNELESLARACLYEVAGRRLALEAAFPPYHPKRIEVKREFEKAYRDFLKSGLISDVGYGEFFRQPDQAA